MRIYELTQYKQTLSLEVTALKNIYTWMINNGVAEISMKDLQKTFQSTAQKYAAVIQTIRENKPKLTVEQLKTWLSKKNKFGNYDVSYGSYQNSETSLRAVKQTVVQINKNALLDKAVGNTALADEYMQMVAQSSFHSGHPVNKNNQTIGWFRIDAISNELILIDEVQSDLVNSITQAKVIINAEFYEDFEAALTSDAQKKFRQKVSPQQYYTAQKALVEHGFNNEKLNQLKQLFINVFNDWSYEGLATIIEAAKEDGVKLILMHTASSIAARDPLMSTEFNKVKMYYDNLAKSFGFKQENINVENISGVFWVKRLS